MSLWAIVPVKPFGQGKSRLAKVLPHDRRKLLNSTMFTRTIRVLKSVPEIQQIIVVSRDTSVLSIARSFEVKTIQEEGATELNKAIARASFVSMAYQASSVIVIPSDLPLMEAKDISSLLMLRSEENEIIIAPDRKKEGTNILYLNPPDTIGLKFGINSFQNHIKQAEERNIKYTIVENPQIALDIDIQQDLEFLRDEHHYAILEELMLDDIFYKINDGIEKNKEVVKP